MPKPYLAPRPKAAMPIYGQTRERFLYLYATTSCSLRCKHCYVGTERLNRAEQLTLEQAEAVLDYFRLVGGHDRVHIIGGEPTRHPQLDRIVDLAVDRGYAVNITTNGDFDPELFDRIPPTKSAFNFSLESADPAIHTAIRGRRDNFEKVTSRIRLATDRGYLVRVTCTISGINRARAFDLIPFVAGLGATILSFHHLSLSGNAAKHLRLLSPQQWMAFCEELEQLPPYPGIAVYYPPTFTAFDAQPKWAARGYSGCPARSFDRPHVYPDGTVYACPLMMDGQRHYARFVDGRLILNTSPDNEMNTHLAADPVCHGCSAMQTCGGGCPAYASMEGHGPEWYKCDRHVTPMCMLWTTFAWDAAQPAEVHSYR